MSEELIRQNEGFVREALNPYFKEMQQAKREKEAVDTPEQLGRILAKAHFKDSLREGTRIIFTDVPHLPNFKEFEKDWQHFVQMVQERFEQFSTEESPLDAEGAETMQEALGISAKLMGVFYTLGVNAYEKQDRSKALGVMGLLSLLNPFLFEPWLVQGMIHTRNRSVPQAIFTLTMAAIIDYNHPGPHLCFAQTYLDLGSRLEAKSSLEVAQFYLPECEDRQWEVLEKKIAERFRGA